MKLEALSLVGQRDTQWKKHSWRTTRGKIGLQLWVINDMVKTW